MLTRTPDPTPQQVLANRRSCSLNIGRIQREIIKRLRSGVPGAIDLHNQQEGLSGLAAIKQPRMFGPAPSVLSDTWVNSVLVGWAYQTRPLAGRVFRHDVTITIYSVSERWSPGDDAVMDRASQRGNVIEGLMDEFLTCCVDERGVVLWRTLTPMGMSGLPMDYGDGYAGVAIAYGLKATPGANGY